MSTPRLLRVRRFLLVAGLCLGILWWANRHYRVELLAGVARGCSACPGEHHVPLPHTLSTVVWHAWGRQDWGRRATPQVGARAHTETNKAQHTRAGTEAT